MLEAQTKWIGEKDFGFHPALGRLPKLYFLKPTGVKFLHQEMRIQMNLIKHPKGTSQLFERDLFHPIAVIDFHIQFRKWAAQHGHAHVGFTSYFEKYKKGIESNQFTTSQGKILPDAVGRFTEVKSDRSRAFLYERHNGKDVKRAINQIRDHVLLLIEGGASLTLEIPIAVSVLFEFEDKACLKRVIDKLKSEMSMEHTRHRSTTNAMIHIPSCIAVYILGKNKIKRKGLDYP